MCRLTVSEWDKVKFGDGKQQIPEEYANEIIELAEKLRKKDIKFMELRHHSIKFKSFCGVISTDNVTIEILPKIDPDEYSEQESRGLFISLLQAAGQVRLRKTGQANLEWQSQHLLDFFIQDFCYQVRNAMRGGMIADYVERSENLNTIRGRLYLVEHLRQNAFNKSYLFCRYDERTIDNEFNRALKTVFRILLRHAVKTKSLVISILHYFDEVADQSTKAKDIDALIFNRTNNHWKQVFKQAKWFLEGYFPDVRMGKNNTSAFLFDMQKLFEKALGEKIKKEYRKEKKVNRRVKVHDKRFLAENRKFKIIPDMVISDSKETFCILDAKWKKLDSTEKNIGISNTDAYQINTYADVYKCQKIALIFPATKKCLAGKIGNFNFKTKQSPNLNIIAVDIEWLASDDSMPKELKDFLVEN